MRQYDISCSIMWRQHYAQPITMIFYTTTQHKHTPTWGVSTNQLVGQISEPQPTKGSDWADQTHPITLNRAERWFAKLCNAKKKIDNYPSTYYASWIVWWQTFSHLLPCNGTLRLKRLNKCSRSLFTESGIAKGHSTSMSFPSKSNIRVLFEVWDVQVHDQGSSHKLQDVQDCNGRVQVLAHGCLHHSLQILQQIWSVPWCKFSFLWHLLFHSESLDLPIVLAILPLQLTLPIFPEKSIVVLRRVRNFNVWRLVPFLAPRTSQSRSQISTLRTVACDGWCWMRSLRLSSLSFRLCFRFFAWFFYWECWWCVGVWWSLWPSTGPCGQPENGGSGSGKSGKGKQMLTSFGGGKMKGAGGGDVQLWRWLARE